MAELRQNTWTLDQWYAQDVAGNATYSGAKQMWAWGDNYRGGLGQNSTTKYSSPVQVGGGGIGLFGELEARDGTASFSDNALGAIKTDGTLWMIGDNDYGQLGQNNRTHRSSPVQVGSGTDWSIVSLGLDYSAAIKTDGTLWMWGGQGANPNGTLGQNQGTVNYSSPVQVPGTTWRNISAGIVNVFATKTDGTMWVWGGQNDSGNLGLNEGGGYSVHMKSSPTQLPGTTWNQATTNSYFTAATKTDGTLWTWGINTYGGLGLNTAVHYSSPVQVGSDTDWSIVKQDNTASGFALKTDGTLWSWGYAANGVLGQNNLTRYSSPIQIPGTTWSKIAGGNYAGAGLKTDGTIWAWGNNTNGALGQNNTTHYSSPVQVGSDTDWVNVAGATNGYRGFIGIKDV